jgi:hypothetical protein
VREEFSTANHQESRPMYSSIQSFFKSIQNHINTLESTITRRENVLVFLIIRFVLMTAMVLGFTWTFMHNNP